MKTLMDTQMADSKQSLGILKTAMEQAGDSIRAEKMRQLIDKSSKGQLNIAFCGHFSAGKSSLINRLCGTNLLPSSPIPTSANVVTIRNGSPAAYVIKRDVNHFEADRMSVDQVSLGQLEAYCVNGTDVQSVEIHYPIPILGRNTALLDTPGIDSTDEAHFMATESALHLADVVFYVMDYNHVQSEMNFAFTKRLVDWGKPLYLVVNQIDKHRSEELSFKEYRDGIGQAFTNWRIQPHGLLYLSLKQPAHPENEWGKLNWLISKLQDKAPELTAISLEKSAAHLIEEHMKWISKKNETIKEPLRNAQDQGENDETVHRFEEVRRELIEMGAAPADLHQHLKKEMAQLLDNANITPAQTRDLAHNYLQSRKSGFKIGLFFFAAKTADEVERRLKAFYDDLMEKVTAHLDWHLRNLFRKSCEQTGLQADPYLQGIEAVRNEFTLHWIADLVNTGAVFSNEYTMTFSKQLAGEVKAVYRRKALELADRLSEEVKQAAVGKEAVLQAELKELAPRLEAYSKLESIELEETRHKEKLLELLITSGPELMTLLPNLARANPAQYTIDDVHTAAPISSAQGGLQAVQNSNPSIITGETSDVKLSKLVNNQSAQGLRSPQLTLGDSATPNAARGRIRQCADKLAEASALLEDIPAMKSICRSMTEKAARLDNRTFTIALFGAFSAGKSSFANALMGEGILPVSPNPTTAAINKIVPPTEEWPHGTAKVKMKSRERLMEDIQFSLRAIGHLDEDVQRSLQRIRSLTPELISGSGKPHYAFLQAVAQGWDDAEASLGEEVRVDQKAFHSCVAEEKKSCFVEFIELFYSSSLSDQGIILVDTPGADSINARHTGVAFDYIKNADAIFFVTYYNHAFSQADREFLLQLGRVKDSFEMDKMFFVVNAADLASSEQELQEVLKHVEANLLRYGIRGPRIYPVSSIMALEAKLLDDTVLQAQSGIAFFERQFIQFIYEELEEVAVNSALNELRRSQDLLNYWLEGAQESKVERERKAEKLQQAFIEMQAFLLREMETEEEKGLLQEIKELLFYVKQRIQFRFNELYNMAFNPSALREDVRDIKAALRAARHDLEQLLSFDLSQELLATTLRIENYLNRSARKKYEDSMSKLSERIPSFEAEPFTAIQYITPEFADAMKPLEEEEKTIGSHYKNAKHFFEGEGKGKLKEELEKACLPWIARFLEDETVRLEAEYAAQHRERFKNVLERQDQELKEHVHGLHAALETKINVQDIQLRLIKLQELL